MRMNSIVSNVKSSERVSIFDDFTGKYALSKTLRFSLLPVLTEKQEEEVIRMKGYENQGGITRQDRIDIFFEKNKKELFDVDTERKERYQALKYYLTELHCLFIKDSLKSVTSDKHKNAISDLFHSLFELYEQFEMVSDDKEKEKKDIIKNINSKKSQIAKKFDNSKGEEGIFQETSKKYYEWLKENLKEGESVSGSPEQKKKFEKGLDNILLSQNVLLLLDKKLNDGSIVEKKEDNRYSLNFVDTKGKEQTLISYFGKWVTYFRNFNEIRGNLYKDERKESLENDEGKHQKISKGNTGQLTTRIIDENFEIFFRNILLARKSKNFFGSDGYARKGTVKIIGNGDVPTSMSIFDVAFYPYCLLQTDIYRYNVTISNLNKLLNEGKSSGRKVEYFKPLYKQLLLNDGLQERKVIREFSSKEEFISGLKEFRSQFKERRILIKNFLRDGILDGDLTELFLNENQTHFFCSMFFGSWSYLREIYRNQLKGKFTDSTDLVEERNMELQNEHGSTKNSFSLAEIRELLDAQTKEDFQDTLSNGWFGFTEEGIYDEMRGNFENFLIFLGFYVQSLLNGRTILSKKERKDKETILKDKSVLEEEKKEGLVVDKMLLENFSPEDFVRMISEGVQEKEVRFGFAIEKLENSLQGKTILSKRENFEITKSINEYCVRASDINGFFALFEFPEGVIANELISRFKADNDITSLFNAIRNFITKGSNEDEKIKLNFEMPELFGGWGYKTEEHPKSSDYKCRFYKKDGKFYIGIVGDHPHSFLKKDALLMDYYQVDGKTIFNSYRGIFGNKYKKDREKLTNDVLLERIEKLMTGWLIPAFPKRRAFLESVIENKINGDYNFEFFQGDFNKLFLEKTGFSYESYVEKGRNSIALSVMKERFGENPQLEKDDNYLLNKVKELFASNSERTGFFGVDRMIYEITRRPFYKTEFNSVCLETKDLNVAYLFEVYCKDFSPYKKEGSQKDLQTLYFEELFSLENQEDPIFKLSGKAEMFFRDKAENFRKEKWEKSDLKSPKTEKLPYKKRRFTRRNIGLHLSIVKNFPFTEKCNIDKEIQERVRDNEDIRVLGLDRGEKELVYSCLLDGKGMFVEKPRSLSRVGSNVVVNPDGSESIQKIDYRKKLDIRYKERMMARRSWTKIEGIRNFKVGFASNAVSEVAHSMVSNGAMVCMEELNHGFKRDRSVRIETGIYQIFEDALVEKLSFFPLEKTKSGVRNALQLVRSVDHEGRKKAGKYWSNQMGAVFYVDAKFTSKTCPHCGFRSRGIGKRFKKEKSIKEKINNGELKVFYESQKDRFRIEYYWQYSLEKNKFFSSRDLYGGNRMETIYSDVDRKDWDNDSLKDLFGGYLENDNIDLFGLIRDGDRFSYMKFGKVFESLVCLRHNVEISGEKQDRISCPKCHFSTHSETRKPMNIESGDANGAYNIARKGLMVFRKIRSEKLRKELESEKGIDKKSLKISLLEWDRETYDQWDKKDWYESENKREL